jgi:methionine biosynthesis protein MetW
MENAKLIERIDLQEIQKWINPSTNILDCGCGDGALLTKLIKQKNVFAYGIEKNIIKVNQCIARNINVIQQDLEGGLALFEDGFFDTVILSQTLQTIHNTQYILSEIVRVGKQAIVTFPNFAYWKHRLTVLSGHMPISKILPYEWYNTPNVRVLTLKDFELLSIQSGIKIIDKIVLHGNNNISYMQNLRGSLALYLVTAA